MATTFPMAEYASFAKATTFAVAEFTSACEGDG